MSLQSRFLRTLPLTAASILLAAPAVLAGSRPQAAAAGIAIPPESAALASLPQLPPDPRSLTQKVAPEVLDRAIEALGELRVLVAFREPETVRQLSASPGAPDRLRWIASTADGLDRDFAPYGLRLIRRYSHLATVLASLPATALPVFAADPRVEAVVPDRKVRKLDAQGKVFIHVPAIQPPSSGAGVGIAILDTGVDYTHPELSPAGTKTIKLFDAYRAASDPNYAKDDDGHGTEVAGIAAGAGLNPSAAGVAYGATVVSLKVLDSSGNGDDSQILDGINAILASVSGGNPYNIRVANMSFGGYFSGSGAAGVPPQPCDDISSVPLVAAFQQLTNAGVLPVVAAGNGGCTTGVGWPACISTSLAVGAVYDVSGAGFTYFGVQQCNGAHGCSDSTTAAGMVACFSDSGPKLDVWAPTCSLAPNKGGGYDSDFCGTSASAPYVSGVAALLAQIQPTATAVVLHDAVRNNGQPITDARNGVTRNLVLADQALAALQCGPLAVPGGVGSNKTSVCSGQQFVITWAAVAGATSYTVEVATDAGFSSPSSATTSAPTFTYSSTQASPVTFYVRVLASASCGAASGWSSTVQVSYAPLCQPTYGHTYYVSGVARLPGVAPAFWYTDLAAFNPSAASANLRLSFHGTAATSPVLATLGAHQQMTWPDVLAGAFADSGPDKGTILVDSDRPIEVLSRTYSRISDPATAMVETFGQSYSGMEAGAALTGGAVGYLANLRSDGVFRTNVEFVNVGTVATDVEFRFFTNAGLPISTVTGTVQSGQWNQIVRALPAGQPAAFAEVRALAAGAQILASASVIDGNSTDPTTIPLWLP